MRGCLACRDDPNCRVEIKLVDGDHRVAVYALKDQRPHDEILYSYGHKFTGTLA